jgi:hypothetical protein
MKLIGKVCSDRARPASTIVDFRSRSSTVMLGSVYAMVGAGYRDWMLKFLTAIRIAQGSLATTGAGVSVRGHSPFFCRAARRLLVVERFTWR